jgi:hypothetical protein
MSPEILKLIIAGLSALPSLIQAGVNVYDRIQQMKKLAENAASGTVTQEQIDAIRAQLDADLDEFNSPLPPENNG